MQIKMCELELKAAQSTPLPVAQPQPIASTPSDGTSSGANFDVSKNISLVPQFRETEVDSYFGVFERITSALNWSREVWPLLLQCKLTSKAQEVCATLSLEDSLKCDVVKAAILRANELVSEAYRQRFRSHKKNSSQMFVEFAREKGDLFDKWVASTYHLESQGALERFHQTLKAMLRKYCLDTSKEWDEGVPLVLFAAFHNRESLQQHAVKTDGNSSSTSSSITACSTASLLVAAYKEDVLQHDIDVGNAAPIKQNAYRVNIAKRAVMNDEVEYLLEHGLAKHSCSPWSSPCLLVPKSDGSARFCTDYRKVNAVTVPDCFPLPRMEDCVDNLGSARYVSKLDLLKGYWQVPLTSRASDISAFVTPNNFLQYSPDSKMTPEWIRAGDKDYGFVPDPVQTLTVSANKAIHPDPLKK
ncbi:hypothetical protein QQF64_027215 [Cirrhinus molitorella]|uniref:ribonuclease H n=1 Tax=Cirrhinus molitorella TaxID=172907 RepID=A0ABR3NCF3_9TELE